MCRKAWFDVQAGAAEHRQNYWHAIKEIIEMEERNIYHQKQAEADCDNQGDNFVIQIASSDSEREAALRLRYQVFTVEEGDVRYADHDRKIHSDICDSAINLIFIARDRPGDLAATLRLLVRKDGAFINEAAYKFDLLAATVNIELQELLMSICLIDRCVVAKEWRRKGVFSNLLDVAKQHATAVGIKVMLVAVKKTNAPIINLFRQRGWNFYDEQASDAGCEFLHVCKLLEK